MNEFDFLSTIETPEKRKQRLVEKDIAQIEEALESEDESFVLETHRLIDGKYQACIDGWSNGMYVWIQGHGFFYNDLDMETMKENLATMKPKLLAYIEGWNESNIDSSDRQDINVTVNNKINIEISFKEARQK
ncbi:hypothetical protein CIY_13950 [Butyrivibrio fibrisolvens 16/4]|nr:hypothetical protein CIY_13950 [Butyrivibrio fibrisolvens 16/4]